jgi:hypothetical protein
MKYRVRALALAVCVCVAGPAALAEEAARESADIVASFVFLGDNQVGKEEAAPGDDSYANLAQLTQTVKDISTLKPRPAYIFFCGDLVDNGADDAGQTLQKRLDAWAGHFREACHEVGLDIPLIPIPGNHELMKVVNKDGRPRETLNTNTFGVWLRWIEKNGFGRFSGNGPSEGEFASDRLAGDNSRLTYSFDDTNGNHFILINTFTLSKDVDPPRGWVPYHWIADDVQKAEANPRVRNIFAFGHLPIRIAGFPFDPNGDNSILNSKLYPLAERLQAAFDSSTKFRGYFCGHLHLWDCSRLPGTEDVWQGIAGNSGSRLIRHSAGAWQEPFFFGFSTVRIHRDGQVGVVSFNRPVPEPYYSTVSQPAARPQTEILLRRGAP